jgi:DnaJ-class molecular chaperone
MAATDDKTGVFDASKLNQMKCPDCGGTGEFRIESENINEDFEVEKQIVITSCPRCNGTGFVPKG